MQKRYMMLLIGLVLAVYLILTVVSYRVLMAPREGAVCDFYPLWYSARVLFLEHRNPYDLQTTLEIRQALYGPDSPPPLGQPPPHAFYYPLPVLLLFLPFVFLPYGWAAAAWLSMLILAILGSVLIALWGSDWRLSPAGALLLVLATLAWYPVLWSLLLGQVAALLLLPLSAGLSLLVKRRDLAAGILLGLVAVKPQLVYLLLPMLLLWAIVNHRWTFVVSVVCTGVTLGLVSGLFLPTWPVYFVSNLGQYADTSSFESPLKLLVWDALGISGSWIGVAGGVLLGAVCLWAWWKARDDARCVGSAAAATLVVSALVIPRVGMINQLVLLWPALWVLRHFWRSGRVGRILSVVFGAAWVIVPWCVAALVSGPPDIARAVVEHRAMSFLLPLVLGLMLAGWRWIGAISDRRAM